MSSSNLPPPGRRLAVSYIDEVARTDPHRIHARLAKSTDPKDGFEDVTFARYKRAVDALAWHLDKELGRSSAFQTLTFVSNPLDFRYLILIMAALKIGWVVFYPSPRNSMTAHLSLLKEANCNVWLVDENAIDPLVQEVTKERPMKIVAIPSLNSLLFGVEDVADYTYAKSFEETRLDPMLILHTSGSTGIPKCIVCTHTLFTSIDAYHNANNKSLAFTKMRGHTFYSQFPLFHAGGILWNAQGLYYDMIMVYAPAGNLNAAHTSAFHRSLKKPCVSILPPSAWKDIANNPEHLSDLENLDYALSASGPMIPEVAAALAKHTHFLNFFGITEASTLPTEVVNQEDWDYLSFDPHFGAKFDQVTDELYEMIYYRDDTLADYQHVFATFPDLQKWSTKDLWRKHPSKPGLFKYHGRRDDIIVLSNGEKFNPVSFEMELTGQPNVLGAVVFGAGQFEAGVLVEMTDSINEAEARNMLWPFVRAYNNEKAVAHSRISKDMILIAKSDKPLPRAGKQTIQKRAALNLYEDEIKKLYQVEADADTKGSSSANVDITTTIQEWLADTLGHKAPGLDTDLFEAGIGMDSLMVTRLARELMRVTGRKDLKPTFIYDNPTIRKLAAQLEGTSAAKAEPEMTREQRMIATLEKFGKDLPLNGRPAKPDSEITVAVTGTTGSLGSYLLDSLMQHPNVVKVYCLNRRVDAEEVQKTNQAHNGTSADLSKANYFQIDNAKPRFGLPLEVYSDLLHNVNLIIHNAWRVDFNLGIASFDSHMYGVRQFTDFCSNSTKGAAFVFCSTIGTVQLAEPSNYDQCNKIVFDGREISLIPEITSTTWNSPLLMGYAESKLVSEKLLERAAIESGINATVCRIGQIAGPVKNGVKGRWSPQEWFPSLIEASLHLGAFPADLGNMSVMDWLPVDHLAEIIVELAIDATSNPVGPVNHYHAVNPSYARYADLLPTILNFYASHLDKQFKTTPLQNWASMLQSAVESASEDDPIGTLHAAQLIPHYTSLAESSIGDKDAGHVMIDYAMTREHSETLKGMEPVRAGWMELWLKQWDFRV